MNENHQKGEQPDGCRGSKEAFMAELIINSFPFLPTHFEKEKEIFKKKRVERERETV